MCPDPVVLCRGLSQIVSEVLGKFPESEFRTNLIRNTLQVDTNPTLENTLKFHQHLRAEMELLTMTTPKTSAPPTKPSTPDPKAKPLRAEEPPGGEKPKGRGKGKGKTDSDTKEQEQKVCQYFAKVQDGCKFGRRCRFKHSFEGMSKKGKCLECGGEGHMAALCPTKTKNKSEEGTTSRATTPKSPSAAKVEVPKASGVQGGQLQEPEPQPVSPTTSSTTAATASEMQAAMSEAAQALRSMIGQGPGMGDRPTLEGLQRQLDELRLRAMTVAHDSSTWSLSRALDARAMEKDLPQPTVLIDSGATNIMRPPKSPDEWNSATQVNVVLADNQKAQLYQTSAGSILASSEDIQPLLPMSDLVRVGCEVTWGKKGLRIRHPTLGTLKTSLRSGCPELAVEQAKNLIDQIEAEKLKDFKASTIDLAVKLDFMMAKETEHWTENAQKFVKSGNRGDLWKVIEGSFLKDFDPALRDYLPLDVKLGQGWETMKATPWTRRKRKALLGSYRWLVHLPVHKEEGQGLKDLEREGMVVITVAGAIPREVFRTLLWGAATGRVEVVMASGANAPGSITTRTQKLAQVLLLYVISRFARPTSRTGFSWFGPEEEKLEAMEAKVLKSFVSLTGMVEAGFDQGAFGSCSKRPTHLVTNYDLRHLHGHRQSSEEGNAREGALGLGGAPQLLQQIKNVIREQIFVKAAPEMKKMTKEQWEEHVRNSHYPRRRDCLQCFTHGATGHKHSRIEHQSLFVLTADVSGPFKQEGLNHNARGDIAKGLCHRGMGSDPATGWPSRRGGSRRLHEGDSCWRRGQPGVLDERGGGTARG